jgi:hypothetical protein
MDVYLLGLDSNGQPGIVPAHLAYGIIPANILLAVLECPHLHDRHRGGKPWGMVIPPIEPDLLAWAKWRAHWTAGVRWRGKGNVLLVGARLLGSRRCGSNIVGWRRLHD